ncbi:hypothetical protein BD311DRAFT_778699 [Dichomitus squalens]|uniref:Uncharacterized protein n=1 Tax=Dichomitus squalens TaxID=114155 RepID=A0A4Q9ML91_9APHY|nr:hypothetical protein BD311DRAFT_778699 [Dichomitus squalens]TBU56627.1 hypothetical protein BD310DRAFT_949955 [Dichomitus squalens]
MLARINTNMHSPDRPSRRPHGPRSACSPASATSVTSAKSARRAHFADVWKSKAGPSTIMIRTSPPQMSLPYDADVEQDPLFNLPEQIASRKPRRYCLKFLDIDPMSSDEESPFDSLFSFTASPVESPSYATTTFSSRQLSGSTPLSPQSFLSPITPTIVVQRFGDGDSVDRWMNGGGLEPLHTPLVADHKSSDYWDDSSSQSDWRELIDQFLQHTDLDDPMFPPTPGPDGTFPR